MPTSEAVPFGIVFGSEAHVPGCDGSAPRCGGVYQCNRCERLCGYCFGAADEMPGVCDDCFCEIGVPDTECAIKRRGQ